MKQEIDVATGKIIESNCGDSRTESDYLLNIRRIIESDPNVKKWHLTRNLLMLKRLPQ